MHMFVLGLLLGAGLVLAAREVHHATARRKARKLQAFNAAVREEAQLLWENWVHHEVHPEHVHDWIVIPVTDEFISNITFEENPVTTLINEVDQVVEAERAAIWQERHADEASQ